MSKKVKNNIKEESKENELVEKLSKQELKEQKKEEKHIKEIEHPLHFHFFSFAFNLILFVLVSLIIFASVLFLLNSKEGNILGLTISWNETVQFIVGLLIVSSFVIWMEIFQTAWRRFFRIGRYERERKAREKILKHDAKIAAKNKKSKTK